MNQEMDEVGQGFFSVVGFALLHEGLQGWVDELCSFLNEEFELVEGNFVMDAEFVDQV